MDETKETQQDNLNETPEGESGTTPKQPKTLEEQVAHIKEVAFAEVGRYRVETEKATKAAIAAEERLNKFIKEQEEAELEQYQDEPTKLTEIRRRQRERERDAELDKVKQELRESKERVIEAEREKSESTKEQNAREIAARLNIDPKLLAKLAKLTDGSLEAIEDIAKDLPRKSETATLKPDSSRTIGGSASFEKIRDDMIKNPSNDAKMRRYMEAKKAQQG